MIIDHIGIAVQNLDESIALYARLFGMTVTYRERLDSQKVELVFIDSGASKIELLAPTAPESKIALFIKNRGPGLHHTCYRVDDIKTELARLASEGVELIDKTPRPGAHGTQIAFLHPRSVGGVLTELCEYPK